MSGGARLGLERGDAALTTGGKPGMGKAFLTNCSQVKLSPRSWVSGRRRSTSWAHAARTASHACVCSEEWSARTQDALAPLGRRSVALDAGRSIAEVVVQAHRLAGGGAARGAVVRQRVARDVGQAEVVDGDGALRLGQNLRVAVWRRLVPVSPALATC